MAEKLERSHIIFIAPKSCPGFPHTLEGLSADDAGAGAFKGGQEGRLCAAGGRLTAGGCPWWGGAGQPALSSHVTRNTCQPRWPSQLPPVREARVHMT